MLAKKVQIDVYLCMKIQRLIIIFLLFSVRSVSAEDAELSRIWTPMGSFASITISPEEKGKLGECEYISKFTTASIEKYLSVFDHESDISALNSNSGSFVAMHGCSMEVIGLSLKYAGMTEGAFDVTVGPLMKLWGFSGSRKAEKIPAEDEIINTMKSVGYKGIIISNNFVKLAKKGMSVDFGGIGKGYAVDKCYEAVRSIGATNFMVNIGGNVRVGGTANGERQWKIGIKDPFEKGGIIGVVTLTNGMAIATSGNYEKFLVIEGRQYPHIIDPRSGMPIQGMAQTTVIAENAVETDALSTGTFVLGKEKWRTAIGKAKDCHVIYIPDEKPMRIYITPGTEKVFKPVDGVEVVILK